MGIGISCGIIAVANRFVPWFFGAGYQKVVILLQVLSPIIVIIGISNIIGSHYYTAVGAEYQKRAARYMMIGAAVNLCLNLALIPYLQSLGAVIASLAAETIITCLFLYNSDGYMNLIQIFRLGWKKLIAGALMILAMFFIGRQITDNTLAVLSEVVVGLATYFIVLYLFKDSFLSYLYFGILKPKLSKILRK
jgi:O-antigen/teichoic acid export membrane protein